MTKPKVPENMGEKRERRLADNTARKQLAPAAHERAGTREPNKREATAIAAARDSHGARPARAAFTKRPNAAAGVLDLACPHSDAEGHPYLVAETFASDSNDFVSESLRQLANATARGGETSIEGLNASIALVGAIAPENELEAALAVQMAATHDLTIEMLRRTRSADNRDAMRDYGNLATKLSRTFTAQMKQLSDWRRGGEQVVRHVHVYEGGQAVVAETVNVGGQGNGKLAFNPYEQSSLVAPMLGQDPAGHALSVPGDARPEPLPASRGRYEGRGRADREQE